jgi:hypothetical protein
MVSVLKSYIEKEQQLKKISDQLEQLKSDPRLKKELEFKDRLLELMLEYGKKGKDVVAILSPAEPFYQKPVRKKRKLKLYKNPHTGEVIETGGGNHKVIKAWKAEYGAEEVESWVSN